MGSLQITELLGCYNVRDFGASGNGSSNDQPAIARALQHIAAQATPNGTLYFPPGTYVVHSSIEVPSNVELLGAGSVSVLKLGNAKLVDVVTSSNTTNIRLRNLRIDGNRANNTGANRHGIALASVTDAWLENVEAVSCRENGFRLEACERVELVNCKASDNGRHGFSISFSAFCQIVGPRSYDNCQVATAGDGDGINFELLSHDNTVIGPACYETSLAGVLQGNGIREAVGEGCYRNSVIGGSLQGNKTAQLSLESRDSFAFISSSLRYLAASAVNPT